MSFCRVRCRRSWENGVTPAVMPMERSRRDGRPGFSLTGAPREAQAPGASAEPGLRRRGHLAWVLVGGLRGPAWVPGGLEARRGPYKGSHGAGRGRQLDSHPTQLGAGPLGP